VCQKCHWIVSRYNSDKRESIWIIFDRNFTEKIGSQKLRYFHKSPNCCFYTTWTNRNPEIASYHSSAVTLHCRNSIASNILLLVFDCCGLRLWCKIHNRVYLPPSRRTCVRRCLFVCLFVSTSAQKTSERICVKFSGKVEQLVKFGGDPDHRLDTRMVFRIRHYWEIRRDAAVHGMQCRHRR